MKTFSSDQTDATRPEGGEGQESNSKNGGKFKSVLEELRRLGYEV